MKYTYEPFVIRRLAENRVFLVSPKMPFEAFVNCFCVEQPFFLVSWLEDGRIAITPNTMVVPANLCQAGYWPVDLFPTEWEYGTIKNGTYPVIITAHPVANSDEWLRRFEKKVSYFATETLADFIAASKEFQPLEYPKYEKLNKSATREPLHV
jgi:hypothetical protein